MRKAAKEDMKGLKRKSKVYKRACTHIAGEKMEIITQQSRRAQVNYAIKLGRRYAPRTTQIQFFSRLKKKYLVAGGADLEADPGLGARVGAPRTHVCRRLSGDCCCRRANVAKCASRRWRSSALAALSLYFWLSNSPDAGWRAPADGAGECERKRERESWCRAGIAAAAARIKRRRCASALVTYICCTFASFRRWSTLVWCRESLPIHQPKSTGVGNIEAEKVAPTNALISYFMVFCV